MELPKPELGLNDPENCKAYLTDMIEQLRVAADTLYPKYPSGLLRDAAMTIELGMNKTGCIGVILDETL